MKLKRSYLFAAAIGLLVIGYFAVNAVLGGEEPEKAATARAPAETPLVRVVDASEAVHPDRILVRGRTEAPRTVSVQAQTAGIVTSAPVPEGAFVRAGQVLCRLDVDARQAALQQARAMHRSEQLQHDASRRLADRGFRASTQVAQDQAQLDSAAAAVRAAEVALEQVNVRAPFAGVFNDRDAEVGSYLSPGQPCGTVVELNPILLVGDVTEAEAAKVRIGAPATATLSVGGGLTGRVRFLSRDADPATRTYRVEVAAPNPNGAVRAGLSAEIALASGSTTAHNVPVAALVLDSQGRQGLRVVGDGDRVAFIPVRVLQETEDGVWVAGLQGRNRVITVGQSFVAEGQKVRVASAARRRWPRDDRRARPRRRTAAQGCAGHHPRRDAFRPARLPDPAARVRAEHRYPVCRGLRPLPRGQPEDAERLLVRPLEVELQSIEGLKEMNAIASQNAAMVVLEFPVNFNKDRVLNEVRAKVDMAKGRFPPDAEEPIVQENNTSQDPVIAVVPRRPGARAHPLRHRPAPARSAGDAAGRAARRDQRRARGDARGHHRSPADGGLQHHAGRDQRRDPRQQPAGPRRKPGEPQRQVRGEDPRGDRRPRGRPEAADQDQRRPRRHPRRRGRGPPHLQGSRLHHPHRRRAGHGAGGGQAPRRQHPGDGEAGPRSGGRGGGELAPGRALLLPVRRERGHRVHAQPARSRPADRHRAGDDHHRGQPRRARRHARRRRHSVLLPDRLFDPADGRGSR
jgi:multidrug efflux system membrane fusion protein